MQTGNSLSLLLAIVTFSCTSTSETSQNFKVKYNGALKNIMHEGDLSATAQIIDFRYVDHFYALGAVEDLKGEVLILNSKPFIASVQEGTLTIDNTFRHNAALLVYAAVDEWYSFDIPDEVSSYEDLEKHIEQVAKTNGINIDEPFPFLIDGVAKTVDWHVVDWKAGDTEHSHEKHITSGPHGTLTNKPVQILGFYSKSHHAVFTHHTTNMHLHFKTSDGQLAGHLDGMTLGQGMTLKLPVPN